MYKLGRINEFYGNPSVMRLADNVWIPFAPDNTDYANFKRHIQGFDSYNQPITPAELQDADGNTMTAEEVAEFVATLP